MTKPTFFQLLLLAITLIGAPAAAAPKAEKWDFWDASGNASAPAHTAWDEFLQKYLSEKDGITLLDYGKVSDEDKVALDEYIKTLAATKARQLPKDAQLAYWINLYNALTVQTILANHPIESIKEISEGFFDTGPWDMKFTSVEGKELSLNDIEHRILRPLWQDARVHYAVNCASIGCPNLAAHAYTAENTEELLEEAAAAYINHERGAKVENGKLQVSSIYNWFAVDFGSGSDADIIAHLRKYAASELKAQLADIKEISGDDYDWSLNGK